MGGNFSELVQIGLQFSHRMMEEMVMKFANRLTLTEDEQHVVVIDAKVSTLVRADRVFWLGECFHVRCSTMRGLNDRC